MKLQTVKISFPDLSLHPHYGHKLRGYFGNLFREHSPLLHNHYSSGELRYAYPLVQYKILDSVPTLIGIEDGAELLTKLFLQIKELNLDDKKFIIYSKNITGICCEVGISKSLIRYKFKSHWMGLNQKNYKIFNNLLPGAERKSYLNKILIGNILSFYKGINYTADERIYVESSLKESISAFKNREMTVFSGNFTTNALLPEFVGLGKSVSRGFGTVTKISS